MSQSILIIPREENEENQPLLVEAVHTPDELARMSGVWIDAAGSAMLPGGSFMLKAAGHWLWLAMESGSLQLTADKNTFLLKSGDCCMVPPDNENIVIENVQEARILWIMVDGSLSSMFMQRLSALPHRAMKQGTLPSQLNLARHIVQASVRLASTEEGPSAQLQQLLWAMLASHSGQPVAMDAVLSYEIARVVDAMRKNQYRDSFSLAEMAAISRMPVETFRKRFVSEIGMPPQSYQLFCKMERAKTLLQNGSTVRQAGIDVGMSDPYHFSKTFKNIVGMSPSAYSKTAQR